MPRRMCELTRAEQGAFLQELAEQVSALMPPEDLTDNPCSFVLVFLPAVPGFAEVVHSTDVDVVHLLNNILQSIKGVQGN